MICIAIANQKAAPTFENTLAAMERSGLLLERTQLAFSAVSSLLRQLRGQL